MEAFHTLYEMTMYNDFASSLKAICHHNDDDDKDNDDDNNDYDDDNSYLKIPTILLKDILKKAINSLQFKYIHFQSAFAGRALAQSGQSTSITLKQCAFEPAAEVGFVDGMLSKTDKNLGLTKICFMNTMPFHSNQNLAHLLTSEYGPIEFSYLFQIPRIWMHYWIVCATAPDCSL